MRTFQLPQRRHMQLVFSPIAWLKLQFFLHAGHTEVGGFGISREDDLLYIEDFLTLDQTTTEVTVQFADIAVANHFDQFVDAGIEPVRFARIWCHTHPGSSADPSSTDEETFSRAFGDCDWAVMFILSRTSKTYARLNFNAGPGGSILLPVVVDWEDWPNFVITEPNRFADMIATWVTEFERNVHPRNPRDRPSTGGATTTPSARQTESAWWDTLGGLTDDRDLHDLDPSEITGEVEVAYDRFD